MVYYLLEVGDFMNYEIKEILRLANNGYTIDEICFNRGITPEELLTIINNLRENNYTINVIGNQIRNYNNHSRKLVDLHFSDGILIFFVITDTHINRGYDFNNLNYVYAKAKEKGAQFGVHLGDLIDSNSSSDNSKKLNIMKIQERYNENLNLIMENYPVLKTYILNGNHDEVKSNFLKKDLVKEISVRRKDIKYLGTEYASLKINNLNIELLHGSKLMKSTCLNKSFDLINYSNCLKDNVNLVLCGHFHTHFLENNILSCENFMNNRDNSVYFIKLIIKNGLVINFEVEREIINRSNEVILRKTL